MYPEEEQQTKTPWSSARSSALLFVVVISLVAASYFFGTYLSRQKSLPASLSQETLPQPAFVASYQVSPQNSVQSSVAAQKLDLQRKIIKPLPGKQFQVNSLIEKSGGTVISSNDDIIVAQLPNGLEEQLQLKLQNIQAAESIEVDYPIFLAADTQDWGVERIQAPQVWDTTSASGIKVGVVDTGIDYTHPDLQSRYAGGYDAVNNEPDPFDDHGHGTHVSGIIASDLNNSGYVGAAPAASIYALKALTSDGSGYVSDLIEAIDWAIDNDVQVLNFSLGTAFDSSILRDKLDQASSRGIYLVAAAGNTGGGALLYPAAYSNVISVSAIDNADNFASFSSLGAELAAPGVAITSTITGGGYAAWSGTSMAAPHVTATIALMIGNGQDNIREGLRNTAIDLGPAGIDSYYGYGIVDAKPAALGEDVLSPLVTFISPENDSTISNTVSVELTIQDENHLAGARLLIDSQEVQFWDQEPFTFLWNTDQLEPGEYTLVAQAADEFQNIGEAKITVTINPEVDSSPSASPTAFTEDPTARSQEVRQDILKRKTISVELPSQASEFAQLHLPEIEDSSDVPEITNVNQRNQRPQSRAQTTPAQEYQEKGASPNNLPEQATQGQSKKETPTNRGKVKGLSTNWLQYLLRLAGFD